MLRHAEQQDTRCFKALLDLHGDHLPRLEDDPVIKPNAQAVSPEPLGELGAAGLSFEEWLRKTSYS